MIDRCNELTCLFKCLVCSCIAMYFKLHQPCTWLPLWWMSSRSSGKCSFWYWSRASSNNKPDLRRYWRMFRRESLVWSECEVHEHYCKSLPKIWFTYLEERLRLSTKLLNVFFPECINYWDIWDHKNPATCPLAYNYIVGIICTKFLYEFGLIKWRQAF